MGKLTLANNGGCFSLHKKTMYTLVLDEHSNLHTHTFKWTLSPSTACVFIFKSSLYLNLLCGTLSRSYYMMAFIQKICNASKGLVIITMTDITHLDISLLHDLLTWSYLKGIHMKCCLVQNTPSRSQLSLIILYTHRMFKDQRLFYSQRDKSPLAWNLCLLQLPSN